MKPRSDLRRARGQIKVRGAAYPIAAYEVADLLENLQPEAQPLKADLPHLRFELDPRRMSPAEHEEARTLLQSALNRLDARGRPNPSEPASGTRHSA